ncbi:MAG: arylsulfatase [Planctomycetota bacterium]
MQRPLATRPLAIRPLALLAAAWLLAPPCAQGVRAAAQPHVVFILADDMGYSDMGFQGAPIATPTLDKLRAGGMYLDRNYAQPQCSPTRVAFLTGRYPYRYGLHEQIVLPCSLNGVPGEAKTVAEKLKEAGYRTAMVGKWHVGGRLQSQLPHHQGFDQSVACINGSISYWNYTHSGRGDLIRNGKKVYAASPVNSEASGNAYATDLWKQEAVDVITSHDASRPLFLFLSFTAPHYPQHVPAALLKQYQGEDVEAYWSGPGAARGRTAANRLRYMAMVDSMDSAIGDVLDALEAKGMSEETLVVFTSDNGGIPQADNRPLRSNKGDSFEGGVRVPAIAYWPGKIEPGSKSSELVYAADWYPTFAEAAGIGVADERLDGVSALGVLRGGQGKRDAVPIISAARHAYVTKDWSLVGSGEDHLQLVRDELSRFELFDLKSDPSQAGAAADEPERARSMKAAFLPHFRAIQRGFFNWDIRYAHDGFSERAEDHHLDIVFDDLPGVEVTSRGSAVLAETGPVYKDFTYRLQEARRGEDGETTWVDVDRYVCRETMPEHRFPQPLTIQPRPIAAGSRFRVLARHSRGLPIRDPFDPAEGYRVGPIAEQQRVLEAGGVLPPFAGFLAVADVVGGGDVEIGANSLAYNGWPTAGGALRLTHRGSRPETLLTRYFSAPHCRGKVFASMLVRFHATEPESSAKINWLRQTGWNGSVGPALSLSVERDGVYVEDADTLKPFREERLTGYDGGVAHLLFEFELGAAGGDRLSVYVNPDPASITRSVLACYEGEFTFDRLQLRLAGRPGASLEVDELRLGETLDDVLVGVTGARSDRGKPSPTAGAR